jgi:hypothetical protein
MNRSLVGSILGRSSIKIDMSNFYRCFLPSFGSFGLAVSEEKNFKLEAQWAEPVSLTFHSALRKLNPPQAIFVSDWSISKYLLLCNSLAK